MMLWFFLSSGVAFAFVGGGVSRNLVKPPRSTIEVSELGEEICLVPGQVVARVETVPGNARRVYTGMDVEADCSTVYNLLTDYEALLVVVPNLVVNEILERKDSGARLKQVGAAQVLPGLNFRASMILDVRELPGGLPESEISTNTGVLVRGKYPKPWIGATGDEVAFRDIAMQSVAGEPGDFTLYQGLWRMQEVPNCGANRTRLTFSVEIQPRPWLPVALIESRITQDLVKNVEAVAMEAEKRQKSLATTSSSLVAKSSQISAKQAVLAATRGVERAGVKASQQVIAEIEQATNRLRSATAFDPSRFQGRWRVLFSSTVAANKELTGLLPLSGLSQRAVGILQSAAFEDMFIEVRHYGIDTVIMLSGVSRLLPQPTVRLQNSIIAPRGSYDVSMLRERIKFEPATGPKALPRLNIPSAWVERITRNNKNAVQNFDVLFADDDLLVTLSESGDLRVCTRED